MLRKLLAEGDKIAVSKRKIITIYIYTLFGL